MFKKYFLKKEESVVYSDFYSLLSGFKCGLAFLIFLPIFGTWIYVEKIKYIAYILDKISISTCDPKNVVHGLIMFIVLSGSYEIFRGLRALYSSMFYAKFKRALNKGLISQILHYEEDFFYKFGSTMILTSVNNIVEHMQGFWSLLDSFINSSVFIISVLFSFYKIAPIFAYLTILWVLIWLFISNIILKISYKYSVETSRNFRFFSLNVGDIINNIFIIKIFNTEEYESENNNKLSQNIYHVSKKNNIVNLVLSLVNTSLYIIFTSMFFYYSYLLFKENKIMVGTISLIVKFTNDIAYYLDKFNNNLSDIILKFGYVKDSLNTLKKGKISKSNLNVKKLNVTNGDIIIDNLKYSRENNGEYQLNLDSRIHIKGGSTVALVGASGGGKTTFLKLLLGVLHPTKGNIIIDGQKISECDTQSLRSEITLVPQDIGLFHRSIMENLKYGSFDATEKEIIKNIDSLNMTEAFSSLEKGYDSILGEDIDFSGGQRQRIMLSRVLLRKAKIFLFDESTSALDSKNENKVLESIEKVTKGCTKFIITHKVQTVKYADLILVFDSGRIVEQGSHQELLDKQGVYTGLFNLL